jgi:hypothetical protein
MSTPRCTYVIWISLDSRRLCGSDAQLRALPPQSSAGSSSHPAKSRTYFGFTIANNFVLGRFCRKARLAPKFFEPRRVGGGVPDGMLNVPMPEIILNQPGICALVGEGEAAGIAQQWGWASGGRGGPAVFLHGEIHPRAMQRLALLADKETLTDGLHAGAFFQPCANRQ